MNATLRQISHHLFEQNDLHKVQIEEMDYLIEEYPYFSAFHLLKAKKMMTENHHFADQALQKAAIFFYNPHWLHYQINHDEPFVHHEEPISEMLTTPDSDTIPEMEDISVLPDSEIEIEAQEVSFDNKRTISSPIHPIHESIDLKNDTENNDSGLIFDPLHTIDYFASQGIRIPSEIIEQDELSIKLKSFTEWLRTMKKIHPEKFQMTQETVADQEQITIDKSDLDNEVITEAMAEVFALQGLKDKAIGIYEKLSLLEPQKNDYFAIRIKELK